MAYLIPRENKIDRENNIMWNNTWLEFFYPYFRQLLENEGRKEWLC